MSTTTDLDVALGYLSGMTLDQGAVLFRVIVTSKLKMGAKLSWLSTFPNEAEVLYPPLTFLQPTGRMQSVTSEVSGAQVTIMEVTPDLSA